MNLIAGGLMKRITNPSIHSKRENILNATPDFCISARGLRNHVPPAKQTENTSEESNKEGLSVTK